MVHYYAPGLSFRSTPEGPGPFRSIVADFRTPAGAVFAAPPLLALPFSRFDPRLVCLDETTAPGPCLRGKLPFLDVVAVFPGK